ncbi:NAD-binding protein [Synechocystis sp. CS-94]|uniref:potassium channel family protein n=1 Tax=unclassified Synechocystis TaxID=2640012 RepID=UPI002880580D|nr:NAD-binding protein [Synechocystis sp. CS-94]
MFLDVMKPHIIVCGLGQTGYRIFSLLKQQGAEVIGVSDRPILGEDPSSIVVGELRSTATLTRAAVQTAQTLVLATSDDALNLAILTQARILNPRIRIVNRLFNHALGKRLDTTLPDHVSLSVSALAAPIFSFAALGNQAIGQLRLFDQTWPIQEIVIDQDHPWFNLPLADLWDDPSRMLIHYLPAHSETDLVGAVVDGLTLQAGDHLIVGQKPQTKTKRRSPWRKISKLITNLREYQRYVQQVIWVVLFLLLMIFLATFTYVSIDQHIAPVDALYFSVGMITGAGGKEEVAEKSPDIIKVFTAVMMIAGAGVIGICYALLNDFILGSRFSQFLDAAKLPDRHHIIICGLGGVSMAVIGQLIHQGHEIVVIEKDADNRFLHTARSLGVPVLVEDARLERSLACANINRAEAIVVATSDDTVNLEIGLTAKAIAPSLPVVLRCQDAQFSLSLQEVFEFETVLCPAELATYSFAAAALGGKILGNGMTDDLLWVALATLITPNHPFADQLVKIAAQKGDFVPLYLERSGKTIHSWELLSTVLTSGDVLYLTMPATALEQLWRSPQTTADPLDSFLV